MPSERGRLHGLAAAILEELTGGPPPALEFDAFDRILPRTHASDPFAAEIATHLQSAPPEFASRRGTYSVRAAWHLKARYQYRAASLLFQAAAAEPSLPRSIRDRALFQETDCLWSAGALVEAEAAAARGRGICEDRGVRAQFQGLRALALQQLGQVDASIGAYEQAIEEARRAGDRRRVAGIQANLAGLLKETGRLEESKALFKESQTACREIGFRRGEAMAMANLGAIHQTYGDPEEAEQLLLQAREILRELQEARLEGMVIGNLAQLRGRLGRIEEALADMRAALELHRRVGNVRAEAIELINIGLILLRRPGADPGSEYARALALARDCGDRRLQGIALGALAEHLRESDPVAAQARFSEAVPLLEAVRDPLNLASVLYNLGLLLASRGQDADARASFERALELSSSIGQAELTTKIRLELDRILAGRPAQPVDTTVRQP